MLKDEFLTVRIEAAKLLIEAGEQDAVREIVSAMQSDEPAMVLYASRAFQEIAGHLQRYPEEARAVFERLKKETDSGHYRQRFYPLYSYWALTYVFGDE